MYNKLLQIISRIEEKDGTPLFTCGIFFNTSRDAQGNIDCIDAESAGIDGKQDYIHNDSQLIEFLNDCGIINITAFAVLIDRIYKDG